MGNISKIFAAEAALNRQNHRVLVKSVAEAMKREESTNAAESGIIHGLCHRHTYTEKLPLFLVKKGGENGLQNQLGRCFGKGFGLLEQHDFQG